MHINQKPMHMIQKFYYSQTHCFMQRFLILFTFFLGGFSSLSAQTPISVQIDGKLNAPSTNQAEMMCNDAGTFQFGQFIGQSNDISPDTIFLCHRDSLFINHDGNAVLTGDPTPATAPGVVYGFYTCPPTIMGPDLPNLLGDCFWLNPVTNLPNVAKGNASGDIWFSNSGSLLTVPNQNGVQYWFAPITIDNFAGSLYEGGGPCVNANTNDAFSVVYLREIMLNASGNVDGDDCLGRVGISGGWPSFSSAQTYQIDIFKVSNPSVKAVFHTNVTALKPSTVFFSVPEPGIYEIRVEDGKSCGAVTQLNMNICDTTGSVILTAPEEVATTGTQICLPITAEDFISHDVAAFSFSLNWNPSVLTFASINSTLPGLTIGLANTNLVSTGFLGIGYSDPGGNPILNVPDGSTLFNVCFDVIGPVGSFSPVVFSSVPSGIGIGDINDTKFAPVFNTGSVLVVDPAVSSFTSSVINTGCAPQSQIKITNTGGTGPFNINWTPNAGTGTISNIGGMFTTGLLPSGNYFITMTDALGQVATGTINLPSSPLGASIISVQQPLCKGEANGIVRVDVILNGSIVTNPGPQYIYTWSPVTVPTPGARVQTGVPAGAYAVTITDTSAGGCTASASNTLSEPMLLEKDNLQTQNASCSGVSNGSITYLARGGTPFAPANYRHDVTYAPTIAGPFTPFQTNIVTNGLALPNLAAGIYRITITDANGCSFTEAVTITAAKTISITSTTSLPVCYGTPTGSITANVITMPVTPGAYMFTWLPMPLGSTTTNTNTSSQLAMIAAGTYLVTATENGTGCSATATVVLAQPDSIIITTDVLTNPTCAQPNSGTIGTTVTGGTSSGTTFTYVWASTNPGLVIPAFGSASNIPAGTYTVTVTDNLGCTTSASWTLTIPPPPTITFDSTSVSCGLDGCVEAIGNPVPGTTITGYSWRNQATGANIGTTSEVCMLNGGNYIVTVTASNGCTATDTLTLFNPNPLTLDTVNYILPSCFGYDDGIIGVVMVGGALPRSYVWSVPGSTNQSLVGVEAGTYTVTVSDFNNCTVVVTTILNNPPQININFPTASIQSVSCPGACDGSATPIVTYNTTPTTFANFNFLWNNGETDSIPNQLCPGINIVQVTDPNNCFISDSVIIDQPPVIDVIATFNPPTCFGDCNGSVSLAATGGTGAPYSYDWGFTMTNPAINLCADTFSVEVADGNGCLDTIEVIMTEPNPVQVSVDFGVTSNVICTDDQNGIAAVIPIGGNPGGYVFDWSGNVGNTAVVTDLPPGTYTVTVSDPNGCTGISDPIVLQNPPPVQGTYLPWEPLICEGDQTTLEIDTIFGGAGEPYQFTVDYGVELPATFPVSVSGGEHIITYLDLFGCSTNDTIFITPGIDLDVIFVEPSVEIELGDTLYLLNPTITGGQITQFTWTPANLVSDPTILAPYANTFESTTYTLQVSDANGCTGEGSIYVKIDPNRNVYIPNAIAPTANAGLNQHWKVFTGVGVDKVNFARVYDRWGELIYEMEDFKPNNDDYSEGWDGKYRGKYVTPGVFVYIVEVTFLDGRVLLYRGDVSVIR
jgi:hypothetical protein